MKRLIFIIILVVGSVLLSNRSVFSDEKTFSVICEGTGSSENDAIKNALRSGIEQYLGVFISGETLVKNNQLISQEILAYSRGYVEDFNIIDKQKENETYKVKIFANIKQEQLLSKLSESNIININTDAVVINVQLEIERKRVAVVIMNQLMEEIFKKGYEIKVSEPKIYPVDDKVKVKVSVNIKQNKEMFEILLKVLEKLGKRYEVGNLMLGKREGKSLFTFNARDYYVLLDSELSTILINNLNQMNVNLAFYDSNDKLFASSSTLVSGYYPYSLDRGMSNILAVLKWREDIICGNFVGECSIDILKKIKTIKATVSKYIESEEKKAGIITFLDEDKRDK